MLLLVLLVLLSTQRLLWYTGLLAWQWGWSRLLSMLPAPLRTGLQLCWLVQSMQRWMPPLLCHTRLLTW
jgi:hypothetical protein